MLKFTANCVFDPEREDADAVCELKHCAKSEQRMHAQLHKFFSKRPNCETGILLTDVEHEAAYQKFCKRFGRGDEIKEIVFGYELFDDLSYGLGSNAEGRKDHMGAQELIRVMEIATDRLLEFGFKQNEIRVSSELGGCY